MYLKIRWLVFVVLGLWPSLDARPYFNDQEAPKSLKDLLNIQRALQENLARTRSATVCLEIGEGSGSGVIISKEGLVLTAAHVSGGVDEDVVVILEDGTKLNAVSLGLHSETDAAMLQIVDSGPFPYVDIDEEDSFRLGDWVFSLGHSGGFDKERGVNVRVGRLVRQADSTIQSDCMLIGGDSGGPLFDMEGKLIGIHSRVGASKEESMHVPIREFQRHWDKMLEGEFLGEGSFAQKNEPGTGFLGVTVEEVTLPESEDHEFARGLKVLEVYPESPADKAGIESGDLMVSVNGNALNSEKDLSEILDKLGAGDSIKINWRHGEEMRDKKFKLGERP